MSLNRFIAKKMAEKYEKDDQKRLENTTLPDDITAYTDIPYIADGHKGHLLDIFYPENPSEKLPVIIDFHPGGFIYGYKEINKPYCFALAQRGFLVFSVNYRLALDGTTVPDQVKDAASALDWISRHLNDYPANESRVYLTGASAGGLLASMAALTISSKRLQKIFDSEPVDLNIKAIGLVSGLLNLETPTIGYWGLRSIALDKGYRRKASYKNLIFNNIPEMKAFPPSFLISSEEDELAFMTLNFQKTLETHHIKHKLAYLKKVEGQKYEHIFCLLNPQRNVSIAVIDQMTDYFKSCH